MTRPAAKLSDKDGKDGASTAAVSAKAAPAERLNALYRIMQSVEGRLGGGEGVEGLYGSITCTGMQRIVAALQAHCRLGSGSCLVDVGAGLGRPLLHAMLAVNMTAAYGVEIDTIKCQKAAAFLAQTRAELARRGALPPGFTDIPEVSCSAIEQVRTLDPATHAYSFWEGVPGDGKRAFGRLVAASRLLQGVAVVQRAIRAQQPADAMRDMGFGDLTLVDSFPVSMSGSGRSFRAYVFRRVPPPLSLISMPPEVQLLPAAAAVADEPKMQAAERAVEDSAPAAAARTVSTAAKDAKAAATVARRAARTARRAARAAVHDLQQVETAAAEPSQPQRRGRERGKAKGSAPPAADDGGAAAEPPAAQQPAGSRQTAERAAAAAGTRDPARDRPQAGLTRRTAPAALPVASAPESNAAQAATSSAAAVDDAAGTGYGGTADEAESVPAAARSPAKRAAAAGTGDGGYKSPKSPINGSPGRSRVQKQAAPPPRQGTLWGHVRSRSRAGGRSSAKAQLFSEPSAGLTVESVREAP